MSHFNIDFTVGPFLEAVLPTLESEMNVQCVMFAIHVHMLSGSSTKEVEKDLI